MHNKGSGHGSQIAAISNSMQLPGSATRQGLQHLLLEVAGFACRLVIKAATTDHLLCLLEFYYTGPSNNATSTTSTQHHTCRLMKSTKTTRSETSISLALAATCFARFASSRATSDNGSTPVGNGMWGGNNMGEEGGDGRWEASAMASEGGEETELW